MRKTVLLFLLCWWPGFLLPAQTATFAKVEFNKADSTARLFSGHSLNNPGELTYKLTHSLTTETQKFRAIYTWICMNISNDFALFSRHKRKLHKWKNQPERMAEFNRKISPAIFRKLREQHATLCTGYAYLLKELALHAGLEVKVIHGYGRNAMSNIGGEGLMNHTWNAVRLDGHWYLCDPTWSSGYIRNGNFVADYGEEYFLSDPNLFVLNHYPEDPRWTLLQHPPSLREFLDAPLIYKSAYQYNLIPITPGKFQVESTKNAPVTLRFKSLPAAQVALRCSMHGENEIRVDQMEHIDGEYIITTKIGTKGTHDIHLALNGETVLSYQYSISRAQQKNPVD